jgi:hypothetical protein
MQTTQQSSRDETRRAFEAVRRRADVGSAFVIAAHGSVGAVFGTMLALTGDGGLWTMGILGVLGAAGAAAWEAARRPAAAAGRMIEARFPECGNVLVTADEVLSGALEVNDAAAARVFDRAAAVLAGIDPLKAAMTARRVTVSLLVIAASLAYIVRLWVKLWRDMP